MLGAFLEEVRLVDVSEGEFARLGVRLTEEGRQELWRRLREVIEDFRDRPPPADGAAYSLFIAVHRDVTRDVTRDAAKDGTENPGPGRREAGPGPETSFEATGT